MRRSTVISILVAATLSLIVSAAPSFPDSPTDIPRHDRCGATVGIVHPDLGKTYHLIFTADSMFEGGVYALDLLRDRAIKASFFFTGNFLRDSLRNGAIVRRAITDGHYVGPHSDRHILLADWDEARTTLVSPDSAVADMRANFALLADYGVDTLTARTIVPPYEWYNPTHIRAYRDAGYMPVSPTPGILTYRDYTTPEMPDYFSSDTIWRATMDYEARKGVDGAIIILHLGTQDVRTDKFYHRLPALIDTLAARGYQPVRL